MQISLRAGALALALVAAPQAGHALDFEKDCVDVLDVDVTVRDELRAGEPMSTARARLQLLASQSALRQTIGEKISAKTSYEVQSHSGVPEDRLYNRIRAQAAGFVKLKAPQETVETMGSREMLVLSSKASVCVPKAALAIRETVFITAATNLEGADLPEFHAVLGDVFSASAAFTLVESEEETPDVQISARIDRIDWGDVGKTVAPDFLAKGAKAASAGEYQRLSVGVTLQGRREDGTVVTASVSQFRNFPPSAAPDMVAAPYVRDVLRQAARELHDKIARTLPEAARPQTQAAPPKQKSEW